MNIPRLVEIQKKYFDGQYTRSISFRKHQLERLYQAVLLYKKEITDALFKDLNKSELESYMCEIGLILEEIKYVKKNLKKWAKVKRVKSTLSSFRSKSYCYQDPYGVVLIISPWNYPFYLTLMPLIGAIAGGNTAIIKPSEISSHSQNVLTALIESAFEPEYIAVVNGAKEVVDELFKSKLDLVFFTGSTQVGKIIATHAAEQLTPLVLELGGKSPCIVLKDASIDYAAKRIAFGKLINAGQTCVAPDYVLVDEVVAPQLIERLKYYFEEFSDKDLPKIISPNHLKRLERLLDESDVIFSSSIDDPLKIKPSLIRADFSSKIMQEEIFGPLLPIITFKDLPQLIKKLQKMDNPLALYLFTNSKDESELVINSLRFGGGAINDTILHLTNHHLPFGGVNQSGMGNYHGHYSFKTFTREKGIIKKKKWPDLKLPYHPYDDKNLKNIKKILK